jgi:hypothetical protein
MGVEFVFGWFEFGFEFSDLSVCEKEKYTK